LQLKNKVPANSGYQALCTEIIPFIVGIALKVQDFEKSIMVALEDFPSKKMCRLSKSGVACVLANAILGTFTNENFDLLSV